MKKILLGIVLVLIIGGCFYENKPDEQTVVVEDSTDNQEAVSYTHLDVYKRQLESIAYKYENIYYQDSNVQRVQDNENISKLVSMDSGSISRCV